MSEQRRGAVRSETARRAILEATARLFAARGYDHLTIEGVAHEAGVGKQTIYRWWPSKSALVADCLLEGLLLPNRLGPPDTGDIRADLVTWLDEIFDLVTQPIGESLILSLIAAAAENPDVGRRLYASMGATSALVERFEAAIAASEIRVDAPVQEIGEALMGPLIVRMLSRSPITPGTAERLVDVVLGPVRAGVAPRG
ncbi:TetR/AcrR family transcriptional regulator [Leifsonia flava]|uniref:TetR/AcrR family transcriptional regulator n=1 Tax=Orlajensenia leifsoniae TaxID=2561933 RepID=A0A4Y9R0W7_9MICO|nr:TetR/AcrR family transcriptional regulator [Leifsonia flava]TFV98364.1 TetR/AcrR family transcriptional regulator [Leifsonia flava]